MRKVIDIEGVIGSRQSKKDPHYNDQEKKIVEQTHIDLQDTTQKTIIKIEIIVLWVVFRLTTFDYTFDINYFSH
jgi:hypothetical protein